MKLVWTILITALAFWAAQVVLFVLLFVDSLTHIILSLLLCFGAHISDSRFQAGISKLLTILLSPVNQIVPASTSSTSFTLFLLLGLDSLAWGAVIGSVIYVGARLRRKKYDF